MQRREGVVHALAHHRVAKRTHQVVGKHRHLQRRLCCPYVA